MKIARLSLSQGPRYGVYDEAKHDYIVLADDPLFGGTNPTGQRIPAEEANLVAPMLPRSKAFGFGGTYAEGATEDSLLHFIKPNTAVTGPNDPIIIPEWAERVCIEPELAIIIGRPIRDVTVERAREAIFGFTLANDVTATNADGRGKVWDTSLPLGPIIDTSLDTLSLKLGGRINGKDCGPANTSELRFSIEEIVAMASRAATLLPGDVILTGTPFRELWIQPGDIAEVELEGIGKLENRVIAAN